MGKKFGIDLEQMSAHGQAAVQAAERMGARTIIYRDKIGLAAIVPHADVAKLDPPDPGEAGDDPLLTLCGTCDNDAFVDAMNQDLSRTMLR